MSTQIKGLIGVEKIEKWGSGLWDRCWRRLLLLLLLEETDETVNGLSKCRRVGGLLSWLVCHGLLSSLGMDVPLKDLPCAMQWDLFFF